MENFTYQRWHKQTVNFLYISLFNTYKLVNFHAEIISALILIVCALLLNNIILKIHFNLFSFYSTVLRKLGLTHVRVFITIKKIREKITLYSLINTSQYNNERPTGQKHKYTRWDNGGK